jgi:hypothetical protein
MVLKIVNTGLKITILLLVPRCVSHVPKNPILMLTIVCLTTADTLTGRTVFVETLDLRSDTEIFNKRAKEKFEHFTGLFSLSLEMPDNQQKVLGAYELPMLFETALKQRLQKLGVGAADAPSPSVPVFQITINQFHINLIGQKWMADISYEASLTQDTQLVAREVVTGSAERLKGDGQRRCGKSDR